MTWDTSRIVVVIKLRRTFALTVTGAWPGCQWLGPAPVSLRPVSSRATESLKFSSGLSHDSAIMPVIVRLVGDSESDAVSKYFIQALNLNLSALEGRLSDSESAAAAGGSGWILSLRRLGLISGSGSYSGSESRPGCASGSDVGSGLGLRRRSGSR